MSSLRTLRTSRSLTFLDLSRLSGIPARTLAEAEYGLRTLPWPDQERLAFVLGVRASEIGPTHQRARAIAELDIRSVGAPALIAVALAATLATATLQHDPLPLQIAQPRPQATLIAPTPALGASEAISALPLSSAKEVAGAIYRASLEAIGRRATTGAEPIAPALLLAPIPDEPAPAFQLTPAGPLGCPVRPAAGRVVITQGYGVGSHAPAAIWGAVDLAIDGDGDGYAEPGATWYTPVVATHAGAVRVSLASYPAGNHVWVEDAASGWRTGYAHLAIVNVISGQYVRAGEVIGLIGSTGQASGPHLDYQVWSAGVNVDPTELVGC